MRNFHVDFDAVRYRRDVVSIDYELGDYADQHRDLSFFVEVMLVKNCLILL